MIEPLLIFAAGLSVLPHLPLPKAKEEPKPEPKMTLPQVKP
jgi:hypothetical protein